MGTAEKPLIGQLLRKLRIDAGLSQKELGRVLEERFPGTAKSTSHISDIENGRSGPSPELVAALEDILGHGEQFRRCLTVSNTRPAAAVFDVDVFVLETVTCDPLDGWAFDHSPNTIFGYLPAIKTRTFADNSEAFLFGFGAAVTVTKHSLSFNHIYELACWEQNRKTVSLGNHRLSMSNAIGPTDLVEPSLHFCYLLNNSIWGQPEPLDTAVRLLACPSEITRNTNQPIKPEPDSEPDGVPVVVGDGALRIVEDNGEPVIDLTESLSDVDLAEMEGFEKDFLDGGFEIAGGYKFSCEPTALGYATLVGTAFYRMDRLRAIPIQQVVDYLVQLQAARRHINNFQIVQGVDQADGMVAVNQISNRLAAFTGVALGDNHSQRMQKALYRASQITHITSVKNAEHEHRNKPITG